MSTVPPSNNEFNLAALESVCRLLRGKENNDWPHEFKDEGTTVEIEEESEKAFFKNSINQKVFLYEGKLVLCKNDDSSSSTVSLNFFKR